MRRWLAWCVLVAACGDDTMALPEPVLPDANMDPIRAPIVVAPIDLPEPPHLGCPSGWLAGDAACDPFPSRTGACEGLAIDVPGSAGCAPISTSCPSGDWSTAIPAVQVPGVQVRYVRGGGASGDGSIEAPFATIGEALQDAPPGAVIAIARGSYDEALHPPRGVKLVGACAAETLIGSSRGSSDEGTITIAAADVLIRDVSISGNRPGVVVLSGSARIEGVLVEGTPTVGVAAFGGSIEAERVIVRGTDDEAAGYGFLAQGGSITLSEVLVDSNRSVGIAVTAEGHATLTDVVVRDTRADAADTGYGIGVDDGSRLDAERLVLERNRAISLFAAGDDTVVHLSDALIRDTVSGAGGAGHGASLYDGANVSIARTVLSGHRDDGLFAMGVSLALTDVVVRGTQARRLDGKFGRGVELEEGTHATLERVLIDDNTENGLFVAGTGTTVRGSDVNVLGTRPQPSDQYFGMGATVVDGAELSLARLSLLANTETGLLVRRATVEVAELHVADTAADHDGFFGRGVDIEGCSADPDTGERVNCADTRVSLLHASVERTFDIGLRAADETVEVSAHDLDVRATKLTECGATTCAAERSAMGVGSYDGALVDVDAFTIRDNELCGVQVWLGSMDLRNGQVTGHPIAVNLQTEGFDTARLEDNVAYEENAVTLDSSELPVPAPNLR